MKRMMIPLVAAVLVAPAALAQPPTGCYICIPAGGGQKMCHLQQQDRSGQIGCDNLPDDPWCYLWGGACAPAFLSPDGQLQLVAGARQGELLEGERHVSELSGAETTAPRWAGTLSYGCGGWVVSRVQSREQGLALRERSRRLVI